MPTPSLSLRDQRGSIPGPPLAGFFCKRVGMLLSWSGRERPAPLRCSWHKVATGLRQVAGALFFRLRNEIGLAIFSGSATLLLLPSISVQLASTPGRFGTGISPQPPFARTMDWQAGSKYWGRLDLASSWEPRFILIIT